MDLTTIQQMRSTLEKYAEETAPEAPEPAYKKYRLRDALRHSLVHGIANPLPGSAPGALAAGYFADPEEAHPGLLGALRGAAAGAVPYAGIGGLIGKRTGFGALRGAGIGAGLGALGGAISGGLTGREREKELAPYALSALGGAGGTPYERGVSPGESIAGQDPRGPFFGEVGEYVGRHSPTFAGAKSGIKGGIELGMLGGLVTAAPEIRKQAPVIKKLVQEHGAGVLDNSAVRSELGSSLKAIGKKSIAGRLVAMPIGAAAGYHLGRSAKEYALGKDRGEKMIHSPMMPYTDEELSKMVTHKRKSQQKD